MQDAEMSLREWRRSAGLTQKELARLAAVCHASISQVERGQHQPTPAFAARVCRALSLHLGCVVQTWDVFPSVFRRLRLLCFDHSGAVSPDAGGNVVADSANADRAAAGPQLGEKAS